MKALVKMRDTVLGTHSRSAGPVAVVVAVHQVRPGRVGLGGSTWCGLGPRVRQIRPTVERLSPLWAVIDACGQCVGSAGVRSRVATTTCSTRSSLICAVRPDPARQTAAAEASLATYRCIANSSVLRIPRGGSLADLACNGLGQGGRGGGITQRLGLGVDDRRTVLQ